MLVLENPLKMPQVNVAKQSVDRQHLVIISEESKVVVVCLVVVDKLKWKYKEIAFSWDVKNMLQGHDAGVSGFQDNLCSCVDKRSC